MAGPSLLACMTLFGGLCAAARQRPCPSRPPSQGVRLRARPGQADRDQALHDCTCGWYGRRNAAVRTPTAMNTARCTCACGDGQALTHGDARGQPCVEQVRRPGSVQRRETSSGLGRVGHRHDTRTCAGLCLDRTVGAGPSPPCGGSADSP